MLFIVPDTDLEDDLEALLAEATSDSSTEKGTGAAGASKSAKVALDLDDASFLKDEEDLSADSAEDDLDGLIPDDADDSKKKDEEAGSSKKNKKKLIIILLGAILSLLIIGSAAVFFLSGGEKEEKPVEAGEATRVVVVPSAPPEEVISVPKSIEWEPFLIPVKGSEGEDRLLYCSITIPVADEVAYSEIQAKTVILRDAIFYYFSKKSFSPTLTQSIKNDLVSAINEHISSKISEVYINEYLVKGP